MTNKWRVRRKLIANEIWHFKERHRTVNINSRMRVHYYQIWDLQHSFYPHIIYYWNHSSKSQLFSTSTAIFLSFLCVLRLTLKTVTEWCVQISKEHKKVKEIFPFVTKSFFLLTSSFTSSGTGSQLLSSSLILFQFCGKIYDHDP